MSESDFESELVEAFEAEYGADPAVAAEAAAKAASFREDHDEDLSAGDVLDELEESPYDAFEHRFDAAVGELAAAEPDCTDSRAYRLAGYDDFAADPSIGG
jgi:hypothetical protein